MNDKLNTSARYDKTAKPKLHTKAKRFSYPRLKTILIFSNHFISDLFA